MKTEHLIAALAADTRPRTPPMTRVLRALPAAGAVSLLALVLVWRFRPDLVAALGSVAVAKTLAPLALALSGLMLARALARPDARARTETALLAVLALALGGALVTALARGGRDALSAVLAIPDFTNCLMSVPALAALPLAAMLWALRAGAPVHPAAAGAAAGLVAAGIGAAVYSLHCPHDAALYFLTAYLGAMAIVVLAGAAIGARVLRW